jgi:2-polyprenyl-3-methyl-5-hydroxy-6-metoxy-1,4-benzoquinol methylase
MPDAALDTDVVSEQPIELAHPGRGDVTRCPVCGASSRRELIAHDRNRETTDACFIYNRCNECDSVFLTNVPSDLSPYYGGSYYGLDPDGRADWEGDDFRLGVEDYRVELLRRHVQPGRLIEIGAGTGGFSAAALRSGFDVSAIEMDERCCRYLSEQLRVHAICSSQPMDAVASLPAARVVAMWHVLEHLPDPRQVLAAAVDRLEPGGILALGVPNPHSLQFRLLRSRWAHLDAPRHLVLIPPSTLIRQAGELGLSCVELTANDPFGIHCNIHGWTYALNRRPAVGPAAPHSPAGLALARFIRPVEHRGLRGSAALMLLRRDRAS